jgi:Rha family phage regulatory protein
MAAFFGKQHKNVLRDIDQLIEQQGDFTRLNFEEIFSPDSYGRQQPAFDLTRDGFTLLVMGFTGKKAAMAGHLPGPFSADYAVPSASSRSRSRALT